MITEGHFVRHFQGRRQARNAALLDVGQDHALHILQRAGLFDDGLVFKGGTALRKCRAGGQGRFSTDLDLAVREAGLAELVFETLHGAELNGFRFEIDVVVPQRRGTLRMTTPFGEATPPGRVDVTHYLPWIPCERLPLVPLPIHQRYDFALAPLPIITVEELISEKLARYNRDSLSRDLYDLFWFSTKAFDETRVRRLTVLKVWHDFTHDGLGAKPFDPEIMLAQREAATFRPEAIGSLTVPVDISRWERAVRRRYSFLRHLDEREQRLARLSLGESNLAVELLAELGRYQSIEDAIHRIQQRPRNR